MLLTTPLLALGALVASILPAQKPVPPTPSPGIGSVPSPTQPAQPSTNSPGPLPDSQIPILLSGTVVIEAGGGPAFNVAIKRVCGNMPHTVAWTDTKGRFSFQWNSPGDVVPDASESGRFNANTLGPDSGVAGSATQGSANSNTGGQTATTQPASRMSADELPGVNMLGCVLEADAPGFRGDPIELTGHRALDNSDLGVIVLHRLTRDPGLSVSATTLMAPREARKAWEKGVQLLRAEPTHDPAGAEREFERAIRIYPKYADAWVDLGRARQSLLKEDGAREAFLRAIDADDKRAEPFIELGLMASYRGQWPEAARYLDRALQLDPVGYPHLWFDDAEADYHVQNLDRAERNVREALNMDPRMREPRAELLLGLVLLSRKDYAGAESALRTYLIESPDVEDWDELNAKLEEIHARLQVKP